MICRHISLVALAALLLWPGIDRPADAPVTWASLERRPLHLPHLRLDGSCPISHAHRVAAIGGAWVLGPGPVYPNAQGDTAFMTVLLPAPRWSFFYGSAWSGQKVPWFVAPSVPDHTPVLIRGHQLDGANDVRFSMFDRDRMSPPAELRLTVHWGSSFYPSSSTRVRAPGCYAYQIDGPGFSTAAVFQAITCQMYKRRAWRLKQGWEAAC